MLVSIGEHPKVSLILLSAKFGGQWHQDESVQRNDAALTYAADVLIEFKFESFPLVSGKVKFSLQISFPSVKQEAR